jgi:polysaccharide export outer membrane protein
VILSAGGSTTKADLRSVIVRRSLIDGTVLEQRVDLYSPLVRGDSLPNFRLQGGDTVIVSRLETGTEQGYDRTLVARTTLVQPSINVRVLVPLEPSGRALRNLTLPNGSRFLDVVASLPPGNKLLYKDEITLMRFDPVKGGIITQTLNPEDVVNGNIAVNIPLQEGDAIIVSRTLLGQVFSAIRVLTQPIRDVFGFANFFSNAFGFGNNNNNNNFRF